MALNGLPLRAEDAPLVNAFDETNLEPFYAELAGHLENMKADGAEATVLYIHWGIEYHTQENQKQNEIAQKLCDMGIDGLSAVTPMWSSLWSCWKAPWTPAIRPSACTPWATPFPTSGWAI